MKSRFDFVNQILIEELYDKRLPALTSFREGLDHFGLLRFTRMYPDTWRPFFVAEPEGELLTAKTFLAMVHSEPGNNEETRAYTHFCQFLNKYEGQSGTADCIVLHQF